MHIPRKGLRRPAVADGAALVVAVSPADLLSAAATTPSPEEVSLLSEPEKEAAPLTMPLITGDMVAHVASTIAVSCADSGTFIAPAGLRGERRQRI
ncbi:hypothetical protein ACFVRD_24750 [Streptomyces sp. NPDC057908]|uniref:hypothetical protein n=1 Tax=Streptomyces sp. NPDC057908 TaxID=3346276 RepID=UPI0036E790CC